MGILLVFSTTVHAVDIEIKRVTKPFVHIIYEKGSFSFIRELCTSEDIFVKVYKKFKNRDTHENYYSPYPSEYNFKKTNGDDCEVTIYTVPIDIPLPSGTYDYLPTAQVKVLSGGSISTRESQNLPKEVFIIK